MNSETIQKIHDDAKQDFEKLTSLLIVAKSFYDEQPRIWQGMDFQINGVINDIKALLKGHHLGIYYLSLFKSVGGLIGFIDACRWCGKSDDELESAKKQAISFGSWRAFDADYSDEYFSIFLPMLKDFMDENSDIFA